MKSTVVKTQHKDKPCVLYNNWLLGNIENVKYIELEALIIDRMNVSLVSMEVLRKAYYAF